MEETRTRFWAAMPASRRANSKDVSRSRCFPTPLVKNIRLGTMSLPNAVASGQRNNECENAQSNTMLCKESMNFAAGRKKREPAGASPALAARKIVGEGSGQKRATVTQRRLNCAKD
jgi:hypothetical protein